MVDTSRPAKDESVNGSVLVGLIAPAILLALDGHMFGVALPTIREDFAIPADMAAWVATVYSVPYMIFTPFYGRLGDALGKRRLLIAAMLIFLAGTTIILTATNLGWLMAGRAVQGLGSAGLLPLCLAIISQIFAPNERGKMLGRWNATLPLMGAIAPLLSGLLIVYLSWRFIFLPILVLGLVALVVVRRSVPELPGVMPPDFLRTFDWAGVLLLGGVAISFLFYASSRPITGVAPLQDMRLLGGGLLLLVGLLLWERHRRQPYLDLHLFTNRTFTLTSLCASIRMFLIGSTMFLIPLYLTDVHALRADWIGLILVLSSASKFVGTRSGGQVADSWGSRRPVVVSLLTHASGTALLALLPATAPVWAVVIGVLGLGLSTGLSQAPLHRAAMNNTEQEKMGMGAGLYTMIRFAGLVFGTALAGVVLQGGLDRGVSEIAAYQAVFWLASGVALMGIFTGWGIRE
ncbi:MAG: MFS transporter [Chloroflexota bacterium]